MENCSAHLFDASAREVCGSLNVNYMNATNYNSSRGDSTSINQTLKGKRVSHTSTRARAICSTAGAQLYSAMDTFESDWSEESSTDVITPSSIMPSLGNIKNETVKSEAPPIKEEAVPKKGIAGKIPKKSRRGICDGTGKGKGYGKGQCDSTGKGRGTGKGYRNLVGKDKKIHSDSAKGRKQPQMIPRGAKKQKNKKDMLKWVKTLDVVGVSRFHNQNSNKYLEVTERNDGSWEVQLRMDDLETGDVVMEKHLVFTKNKSEAIILAKKYMEEHPKG